MLPQPAGAAHIRRLPSSHPPARSHCNLIYSSMAPRLLLPPTSKINQQHWHQCQGALRPAWLPALRSHLTSPYKPEHAPCPSSAPALRRSSQDRSVSSTRITATHYLPVWRELGTKSQSRKHFVSAREENIRVYFHTL